MLAPVLAAALLAQAPLPQPAPGVHVPRPAGPAPLRAVTETELWGELRIKQETFLRWQPIAVPGLGFESELRPTWRVEITSLRPRLSALALVIESAPSLANSRLPGVVRSSLQIKLPGTASRLSLNLGRTLIGMFSSALGRPLGGARGGGFSLTF